MRLSLSLILLSFLLTRCDSVEEGPSISKVHARFQDKVKQYALNIRQSPNSASKDQLREYFLDSLNTYITDSLNGRLDSIRVTVRQLTIRPVGSVMAFYCEFVDNNYNKFWYEIDKSTEAEIKKTQPYNLLKDLPENKEVVLAFKSPGDIKWDDNFPESIRLQIEPIAVQ